MRFNRPIRRGVASVESALVLTTLLILVFGILDLGIATYRYNLLAEAARRLSREAIVRGNDATPEILPWGPVPVTTTASDDSPTANFVRPLLAGFDLSQVTIEMEWLDGGNESDDRVRVKLGYLHDPAAFLPLENIHLRAVSTMHIVH
jgi:hypothetical protein